MYRDMNLVDRVAIKSVADNRIVQIHLIQEGNAALFDTTLQEDSLLLRILDGQVEGVETGDKAVLKGRVRIYTGGVVFLVIIAPNVRCIQCAEIIDD